jgi:hypothetical protein
VPLALEWHLDWVFFQGFLCSSLLYHPNIPRVFGQPCLLLNICFFEEILDRSCTRIAFFRASSAFDLFEAGLRSLELSLSGQQRLRYVRGRTSVPRTIAFGPAAPSICSRQDFGPSNRLFQASSAFKMFEAGLRSLESTLSGQQRLQDIRGRASGPQIVFFRASSAFEILDPSFSLSSCLFGSVVASENSSSSCEPLIHPFSGLSFELSTLLNQHARILVANNQFGCRMSNTKVSPRFAIPDGPVIVSNALCWKLSIPAV